MLRSSRYTGRGKTQTDPTALPISNCSNPNTPVQLQTKGNTCNVRRLEYLSASLLIQASEASSQKGLQRPSASSLPSQQSHTPSPTLEEGRRNGRCPRLMHSNIPDNRDGRMKGSHGGRGKGRPCKLFYDPEDERRFRDSLTNMSKKGVR